MLGLSSAVNNSSANTSFKPKSLALTIVRHSGVITRSLAKIALVKKILEVAGGDDLLNESIVKFCSTVIFERVRMKFALIVTFEVKICKLSMRWR